MKKNNRQKEVVDDYRLKVKLAEACCANRIKLTYLAEVLSAFGLQLSSYVTVP